MCLSPEDNEGELRRKESPTQFSQAPPPPSDERKEGFFTLSPFASTAISSFSLACIRKSSVRPTTHLLGYSLT